MTRANVRNETNPEAIKGTVGLWLMVDGKMSFPFKEGGDVTHLDTAKGLEYTIEVFTGYALYECKM